MNNLLLDTHVLIWLMNGDASLSIKTKKLIEKVYKEGSICIAAISVWEVAMLEKKQRIVLNKPCFEWIKDALRFGIRLIPLSPEIAIESCYLPGYLAGDPADRIIIASARVESLCLVTCDEKILTYGEQNLVLSLNARI